MQIPSLPASVLIAAFILLLPLPAAAEPQSATFALIVGVNRGADRDLPMLRYADDDAARYQALFRLIGARTHLLARLDANTRRLHPQAAAEALLPRRAELERVLRTLTAEIRQARRRGVRTTLYVVYAGHGNVKQGEAYVLLENDRLNAKRLAEIIERPGADAMHLIVDACNSGLLASSRGPGGKRRPLTGFSHTGPLVEHKRIGLLLSTSSGRESHEWEQFQAGVFSHEVRSGLYGAADANRDGRVSYREIAAFVERANAAVPNERYRPDVLARPPASSQELVDMRRALRRRIDVRTRHGSHWLLENDLGVRLADFHPGANHEMRIARRASELLFLRRVSPTAEDEVEYAIPPEPDVVAVGELEPAAPRVAMRGAAHESFKRLFSLPFDARSVASHRPASQPTLPPSEDRTTLEPQSWRKTAGISMLGLSAAAAATGVAFWASSEAARNDSEAGVSQRDIAERNDRVADRRLGAYIAFGIAGIAAGSGIVLLAWPDDSGGELSAGVQSNGVSLTWRPAPRD
jgi:hypothetical protein